MSEYVDFDEYTFVEACLGSVELSLSHLIENRLLWRGIVIDLHAALQGMCVCILATTAGTGPLLEAKKRNDNERLLAGLQKDPIELPQVSLDPFPRLVRKLPRPIAHQFPEAFDDAKSIGEQNLWLLHHWRTRFAHFPIESWSIDESDLLTVSDYSLDLAERWITSDECFANRNRFPETRCLEHVANSKSIIGNAIRASA